MPRPKGASWKQKQIQSMRYMYGNKVDEWKDGGHVDDRDVFCRTYRMAMKGLQSLPPEPDIYIRVAVGDMLRKDRAMMDRIAARFDRLAGYEGVVGHG